MYPGMQVTIDLTGKIDEASDRVKITRVIVDSTSIEGQTIWNNNLSRTNIKNSSNYSWLFFRRSRYLKKSHV